MRLSNLENNKVSDFKVAIVQGNIPQELKWNQMLWPTIMKKYHRLTEEAIKLNPDIIIWPETAFPGFIGSDDAALEGVVDQVAQSKIPLLFGSVVRTKEHYYNSAQMIDKNGSFYAPYYKMHLVPFGEYVPMRRFFPFFADLIPIADFTPGNHHITFPWNGFKLAVLICFEDTVDYLSRRMVLSGAHVLINLTNDAWFEDTKQPYLHLQTAVFRSVENRRAMIRATNTGVSAYISPEGIITHYLEDISGRRTYIDGVTTQQVPLMKGKTFYTRFGNVFVVFCALGVLGGLYLRRWT